MTRFFSRRVIEWLLLTSSSLFSFICRCELLSDQLRYLSEKVEELNRENDERRVVSEALQVTNHSMSDRIEFLKQASEYQQSILTAQLRDVEDRYVVCVNRLLNPCSRNNMYR